MLFPNRRNMVSDAKEKLRKSFFMEYNMGKGDSGLYVNFIPINLLVVGEGISFALDIIWRFTVGYEL